MTEQQIVEAHLRACRSFGAFARFTIRKAGGVELERPNVPGWFEACFESYWKTVWKKIPVGIPEREVTNRDVGYYMGYVQWMAHWMDSLNAVFAKLRWTMPKLSEKAEARIDQAWKDAIVPPELATDFESIMSDETVAKMEAIEVQATELQAPEAASYYEGKSQGVLGPSGSADGKLIETDATAIYLLLMMLWPWVIKLPSVTVLHRVLTVFLGRNRVGGRERVAKICERIGLRLRGRGAPKKLWPFVPRKKRKSRLS